MFGDRAKSQKYPSDVGRWPPPKVLVAVGSLLMAAGIVILVLVLHVQHDCLVGQSVINGENVDATETTCSYGPSLGISYLTLALGAGVIVLGALVGATPKWRETGRRVEQPRPRNATDPGELGHALPWRRATQGLKESQRKGDSSSRSHRALNSSKNDGELTA